ncbi:SMR family transporter [Actinomycetospora sp. NBRC 106375]|uniref:DMT family transporter n=1 Tax=Actinomycetospora sp. NBRC 106375 TaxID=3032207 RepID=UPI0025570D3D|nr:SMR family transporter [Actinomycetospora sp. NBRC 106375]
MGSRGVVLLAGTVVCEVLGTVSLSASDGFTRPAATLGVLTGYAVAVLLFSRALEHGLPLGIAYGTVTGCGLVSATVLSAAVLGDPVTPVQAGGLALILGGALLLQRRVPA